MQHQVHSKGCKAVSSRSLYSNKSQMSQHEKCCQCFQQFSQANYPRALPLCGHNICTHCLNQIIQTGGEIISCYFCSNVIRKKDIRLFPKNTALIALLKKNGQVAARLVASEKEIGLCLKKQLDPSLSESEEVLLVPTASSDGKPFNEGRSCSPRAIRTKELNKNARMGSIVANMQTGSNGQTGSKGQMGSNVQTGSNGQTGCNGQTDCNGQSVSNLCKQHQKPLDIICISDKQTICPHCAIFGNHKDHRFKTIREFEQQVQEKQTKFLQIKACMQQVSAQFAPKLIRSKMQPLLSSRKETLASSIQAKFNELEVALKGAREAAFRNLHRSCEQVIEQASSEQEHVALSQLSRWEQDCEAVIKSLSRSQDIREKIGLFYMSPLQIVSQGMIYVEEAQKQSARLLDNYTKMVNGLQISFGTSVFLGIHEFAQIKEFDLEAEQKAMLALEETNQFLSTIDLAANISIDQSINQSFAVSQGPHNRTSHDILGFDGKTAKKFNTRKPHGELLKSAKSLKNLNDNNYLKAVLSPKAKDGHLLGNGNSPDLRFSGRPGKMQRSPLRRGKALPVVNILRDPEKIMVMFTKNHMSDVFDISDCDLDDQQILDFVKRARKIHKTKGLKLSGNRLTSVGFDMLIDCLQGVSNINLSNNRIDASIFDVILRNKERLESLRIIHLSNNQVSMQRNTAGPRFDQVKKLGIVMVL